MLITLTTDFGTGSPYVAQMKGVLLSINPQAIIVDITHAVPPQDIAYGALVLDEVTRHFPPQTIHVAVVDPGVGTDRAIVYAELGSQRFIAPDNGLLTLIAQRCSSKTIIRLENRRYWLAMVSNTFHGRDIMAPAAAHLSRGIAPAALGTPIEQLTLLPWPAASLAPREVTGCIMMIDSFGNLITNITADLLPTSVSTRESLQVCCAGQGPADWVDTYGQRPAGTLVALLGSSGHLEVAVCGGSAAERLRATPGQEVVIRW